MIINSSYLKQPRELVATDSSNIVIINIINNGLQVFLLNNIYYSFMVYGFMA